jgi:hypothetical protein
MSDDINDIVEVQITLSGSGVSQAGFGTMVEVGITNSIDDLLSFYSSPTGMLDAGFTTDEPLYKSAVKYFLQKPKPNLIAVGNIQLNTVAFFIDSVLANETYTATVDGVDFEYESIYASLSEIVIGLSTEIDNATGYSSVYDVANGIILVIKDGSASYVTLQLDSKMSASSFFSRVSVDASVAGLYSLDINSETFEYLNVASTVDEIATALSDDINTSTTDIFVSFTVDSVIVIVGLPSTSYFEVSTDSDDMTIAELYDNTEIITGLLEESDAWYGFMSTLKDIDQVETWAAWAEVNDTRLLGYRSSDTDIINTLPANDTSTVPAILKTLGYSNVFGIYHSIDDGGADDEYITAALFGARLTFDLDNNTHPNWMFAQLIGITPDKLTTQQRLNACGSKEAPTSGKNINVFTRTKGANFIKRGMCASGVYIDTTVGKHWFVARLQEEDLSLDLANPGIPFDDGGLLQHANVLKARILKSMDVQFATKDYVTYGEKGYFLEYGKREDYSAAQITNRLANKYDFEFALAGKINGTVFKGTAV